MNEPLCLTVPGAAARLGISSSHAWRLIYANKLPSVRLGRRRMVPVAALEGLLEELLTVA